MDKKLEDLISEAGMSEQSILSEMATRPWRTTKNEVQEKKEEVRERKDETRKRIRESSISNGTIIRRPKPVPSINDTDYKRVAVYARVSTKSEEQVSSIENQTKYYTEKIEQKENWDLYKIYADEGKSGTSMKKRTEFKKLVEDASKGEFDMILCASVSRFARNITDCIEQVKHLKNDNPRHPVGVYFETEGLYTLDPNSTMALFIHAMLADWESDNKSKRMILSYDQRICTGQFPVSDLLGYRHTKDGELIIQEDEAKTVRFIFLAYLAGCSLAEIARTLTEKARRTLTGRTDWNASMVRQIMKNERRWGDLEARKNIVLDYKDKKVVKNCDMRVSAFVPNHHEGIVSRDIATAVKMITSSNNNIEGVPEMSVIETGGLKGFVSVIPGWSGIDSNLYLEFCKSVYSDEEYSKIEEDSMVINGNAHSKVVSLDLAGYEIPSSAFFIENNTPTITFSNRLMKLNKRATDRFENAEYVEILYHPILKVLVVRDCEKERPGAIRINEEGCSGKSIPSSCFCKMIYDAMDWIKEYRFRFRGVSRKCGNHTAMVFFLDEPQILVNNSKSKGKEGTVYIPYRNFELRGDFTPEVYLKFGITYAMKKRKDKIVAVMGTNDAFVMGTYRDNPVIGNIPSKKEVLEELGTLLKSM